MAKLNLPQDGSRTPLQFAGFSGTTLATTYDATISASTELTLNAATTVLTVTAIDKAICMKWGAADVTTSNFDALIPANSTRYFMVPTGTAAVNFIEQAATAILGVVEQ